MGKKVEMLLVVAAVCGLLSAVPAHAEFGFGEPELIPSTQPFESQAQPGFALKCDTSGTWIAAWSVNTGTQVDGETSGELFYSRSVDNGETWSEPVVLQSFTFSTDLGWYVGPFVPVVEVAHDGHGNWVIVYALTNDDYGIFQLCAIRSSDSGETWSSTPVIIESTLPIDGPGGVLYTDVSLTAAGTNKFAVAYYTENGSYETSLSYDLQVRQSADGGATWSAQKTVAEGTIVITPAAYSNPPSVPALMGASNGVMVLLYESNQVNTSGDEPQLDLMCVRSTDNGVSWSTPGVVDQTMAQTPRGQYFMSMAAGMDPEGNVQVAWIESDYPDYPWYTFRSTDFGASWESVADRGPIPETASGFDHKSLKFTGDGFGNWLLTYWNWFDPMVGAISNDNGDTWTTLAPITTPAAEGPLFVSHATNRLGRWGLAYIQDDETSGGIFVSLSDTLGPVPAEDPVATPNKYSVFFPGDVLIITGPISGSGYQWYKDGDPLSDGGRISGTNTNQLTITDLTLEDSGTYWLVYDDGSGKKTIVQTDPVVINVVDPSTVPAAGLVGLALAIGALSIGSTLHLRKKK